VIVKVVLINEDYTERPKGGTGLIITGVTFVDNEVEWSSNSCSS
jgi:2,4-dienoyl-CoA reductase-like NADH-dependent reductase (Old Yellow Enzyme family)